MSDVSDWPIVASVSGGKDSAALCLWLKEEGLPYTAVHMDTGWEHPATDEYIRTALEDAIGPIEWIVPERCMVEMIRKKGAFPCRSGQRSGRFCTELLKVKPLIAWLEEHYPDARVINAVGIRAEESVARAKLAGYEESYYGHIWRPLLTWKETEVIEIHKRHGLKPNPLYLWGASRVGCWPCIFARKAEIRMVADLSPWRVDEIRELEREVTETARRKYAERGEPFNGDRAFFAPKEKGHHRMTPIDEIVRWSRTSHGGKQYELFAGDEREGCMRWGLCES